MVLLVFKLRYVKNCFQFGFCIDYVQHRLDILLLRRVQLSLRLPQFETGSDPFREFYLVFLFQYVVKRLGLSEAQAYSFISVGRKSKEVPQIKEKIKNGELTVSKAKKITSVITAINQGHWLSLAQSASQKKVEREVALAKPKQAIWDKMTYVSFD